MFYLAHTSKNSSHLPGWDGCLPLWTVTPVSDVCHCCHGISTDCHWLTSADMKQAHVSEGLSHIHNYALIHTRGEIRRLFVCCFFFTWIDKLFLGFDLRGSSQIHAVSSSMPCSVKHRTFPSLPLPLATEATWRRPVTRSILQRYRRR